jgi:hypothetical protein
VFFTTGIEIGILVVLVLIFAVQILIARRAGGALGNEIGYALLAAGALSMLIAKLVVADALIIGFSILSALLFLSGTIALVVQLGRIARSRDPKP